MVDSDGGGTGRARGGGPPPAPMSRAARNRAKRGRRRRRFAGGFAARVLVVVVVGAASSSARKLWHTLFGGGNDYTGDGKRDLVIQIQAGDSTTAIGETLQKQRRGRDRAGVRRRRARQLRDHRDPARLLPDAHRNPGGQRRCAAGRPEQPGGPAGHPGRTPARRHHRHEDQRGRPPAS